MRAGAGVEGVRGGLKSNGRLAGVAGAAAFAEVIGGAAEMRAGAAACAAVVLRRERLFSVKNPEAFRARPRLLRLDPVQESGTVAIIVTKS